MKRSLSAMLLFLMLLQGGGFMFILFFQQLALKSDMQARIEDGNVAFEKLTISLLEYKSSLINPSELLFKGQLYDIKSKNILVDRVDLVVVNDANEKNVVDEMMAFVKRSCKSNSSLPKKSVQLFSSSFIGTDFFSPLLIPFSGEIVFMNVRVLFDSRTCEVLSPPPWVVA